jgi:hypothetical protein
MLAAALAWAARTADGAARAAGGRLTLLDGASQVHPCPWAQSSASFVGTALPRCCPRESRWDSGRSTGSAGRRDAYGPGTVVGITVTAAARPASSERRRRDGPGHRRPSRPGLFLPDRGRPMPSPRSAANPASHPPLPREHLPGLLPVAASRLVTGLSRVSCRDASGLAVLMGTGRRAGLPGVSRLAAPAPPLSRLWRITGPGRQTGIFSRTPIRRTRPARRRRPRIPPGDRRLQPAARAAGWLLARGPPVNSRCRGGLACRRR